MDIDKLIGNRNIAEELEDADLLKIGRQVVNDFKADEESRIHWLEEAKKWMKLATQVTEEKTFPWPKAANIKFPLLTTATLQFGARAYPALINNGKPIARAESIGFDLSGDKQNKAERISKHLSYQIMHEIRGWEEDMDKLLIQLPIIGCAFKKTYYDSAKDRNCSDLVSGLDVVVDYSARSLDDARRITHIIEMVPNVIQERINAGIFRDVKLPNSSNKEYQTPRDQLLAQRKVNDTEDSTNDRTRVLLEQHRWLDLDEDDYQEPYIVTVDLISETVLRIVPRFAQDGIKRNDKRELILIEPIHYFTKFDFIPNPDGGFYGIGFGILLGPLNETANTLINQILDAGTLSNLQGGFLARGIRVKNGNLRFTPGEWKEVNTTGTDLKNNIVPLPTKEPSNVLFQLLGSITEAGQRVSSVSDIFSGEMPGQNTPATTTMAAIDQGMKVFSAIYKRIYRSLGEEFRKIAKLNALYLEPETYFKVLGQQQSGVVYQDDYRDSDILVIPSADPNTVTDQAKMMQAQMLMQMIQFIPNKVEVIKRVLESANIPGIEILMQGADQPPPPSPEQQQAQMEMQQSQAEHQMKLQEMQGKLQAQEMQARIKTASEQQKLVLQQEKMRMDHEHLQMKMSHEAQKAQFDQQLSLDQMAMEHHSFQQKQQMDLATHQQQQKLAASKEKANNGKQPTSHRK